MHLDGRQLRRDIHVASCSWGRARAEGRVRRVLHFVYNRCQSLWLIAPACRDWGCSDPEAGTVCKAAAQGTLSPALGNTCVAAPCLAVPTHWLQDVQARLDKLNRIAAGLTCRSLEILDFSNHAFSGAAAMGRDRPACSKNGGVDCLPVTVQAQLVWPCYPPASLQAPHPKSGVHREHS